MLTALQTQVTDWLRASAPFAGPPAIPIVTERMGDWLNRMQTSLNQGGVGLALVVTVPKLQKATTGILHFAPLIAIHIWENVLLNDAPGGAQIPAGDAVLAVLSILSGREASGGWSPLILEDAVQADNTKTGIVMYEVVMKTAISLRPI